MKKASIILSLIASIIAIVLSVLPLSNLAFIPAIIALLLGIFAFLKSKENVSARKTIQFIFLLTTIALAISTYKAIFNTVEVGNTEQLQEREKASEENAIEELEDIEIID